MCVGTRRAKPSVATRECLSLPDCPDPQEPAPARLPAIVTPARPQTASSAPAATSSAAAPAVGPDRLHKWLLMYVARTPHIHSYHLSCYYTILAVDSRACASLLGQAADAAAPRLARTHSQPGGPAMQLTPPRPQRRRARPRLQCRCQGTTLTWGAFQTRTPATLKWISLALILI